MICLGLSPDEKRDRVRHAVADAKATRVFALGPRRWWFDLEGCGALVEWIDYPDLIRYVYYYRLLQEIDGSSLVVVNECLRTQDRNDLTYNCIRNYLQKTPHQVVFQRLPIIDSLDDFGVLFDFDTRSRWKRTPVAELPLHEARIEASPVAVSLRRVDVPTPARLLDRYAREKRRLIDGIGLRDPHTIPRQLHILGGSVKAAVLDPGRWYVARNSRLGRDNVTTYGAPEHPHAPYGVLELCHRFLDWTDFLASSGQSSFDVLTTELRVDHWYFDRFSEWSTRLAYAYAALHG